MIRIVN